MPNRSNAAPVCCGFLSLFCIFGMFCLACAAVAAETNFVDTSSIGISAQGDRDVSGIIKNYIRNGVVLRFPPGRYLFDSTLTIPENVSGVQLIGTRDETVFLKASNGPVIRIKGSRNIVSDVIIDGQCTQLMGCGPDRKKGSNILINGSYNLIANVITKNAPSNGIHFDGQASNCEGNYVISSIVENNMRVGIASAKARNLVIAGNTIRANGYEGITADLSTENIYVYNNLIEGSNHLGGIGAFGFDRVNQASIVANKFICEGRCKKPFIRAGNATGESSNVLIVDNLFSGGGGIAIDLRGTVRSKAGNRDFVIKRNVFKGVSPGDRLRTDADDRSIVFETDIDVGK